MKRLSTPRRLPAPIRVQCDAGGTPLHFIWRGHAMRVVEAEERWRYRGKWWLNGRGWKRHYFRVSAQTPSGSTATFELFRQITREGCVWMLARVCD